MSLKGNLNSVDLANIFQMLSINQKEGTLDVFDGETRKRIHFSPEGVAMLSRGDAERDSLGSILLRYDQVTEEYLAAAIAEARGQGRSLAAVLREQANLPSEVIEDAQRVEIEEEIQNLFIRKDLTFEFHEGTPPDEPGGSDGAATRVTFNVNSLIMEAARRIDEWEMIRTRVPSTAEIYRYTGHNMELSHEVFEEPWIDKVLGAIDGRNDVEEIVHRSHGNRFEICQVLSLLLEQGAVEPVPPDDLSAEAGKALAEGRTGEAVKFLERLLDSGRAAADTAKILGEAYERSGEVEKAARTYLKHAEMAREAGSTVEPFEYTLRASTLLPTDLRAGRLVVELFHEHCDELADRLPEVVRRGKETATCLFEIKDHQQATDLLKMLLEHAPEDFALRNLLVNFYLASGRAPAAVDEFLRMADWYTRQKDWEQVIRILRRILSIDRSRTDVYQRLEQLLAKKQKVKRGLRHVVLLGVLLLCVGFLAYAYFGYELDARKSIEQEELRTGQVFSMLDKEVRATMAELEVLEKDLLRTDYDVPRATAVMRAAESLRSRYAQQIEADIQTLEKVVEQYKFSSARNLAVEKQQDLRLARSRYESALEAVRAKIQQQAIAFAAAGEQSLVAGHPSRALDLYRKAWEIAADREPFVEAGIDRILSSLSEDLEEIGRRVNHVRALADEGSMEAAREEALSLLGEYWLAEMLDEVDLPVRIESVPSGVRVFLNGVDTGVTTPGFLRWKPGVDAHISFVGPGFMPATETLVAADPRREKQEMARLRALTTVVASLRKELKWETDLSGAVEAGASASNEEAVFATRNSIVYRIAPGSREQVELHRFTCIGGIAATPVLAGGRVFAASVDGEVVALSRQGGAPLWSRKRPGSVYAGLVSNGSLVVVADTHGGMTAFDCATGTERWQRRLPGEVREDPVLSGDRVFAVTTTGHVLAIDLESGEVRFDVPLAGVADGAVRGPAVDGGVVCVALSEGRVVGLDASVGDLIFDVALGTSVRSAPVAAGGSFLLVGDDGGLRAVRAGCVLGTLALGAPGRVLPGAAGGFALVATEAGSVLALESGETGLWPRWKVDLPSLPGGTTKSVTAGAVVGESVLLATESGRIFLLSR
jgi:tetratricopeptide (TPR) repeat protein